MPLALTTEQIKLYVPISAGYVPDSFADYVLQAEQDYLIPELGEGLYEAIVAPNSDYPEPLKTMLARAGCHLAWDLYLPFQEAVINNTGVVQMRTDNEVSAKSETIQRMQDSFQQIGLKELEKALLFIERNADDEKYEAWKEGNAYALARELLVPNLSTFERALYLGNSRRMFARVIPLIRIMEYTQIRPVLTKSFYEVLKANPDTPENRLLLDTLVLPALTRLALAYALPSLAVVFGYDTVLNFENTGAGFTKAYRSTPVELLNSLAERMQAQGKEMLSEIVPYLIENASDFPAFTPPPSLGMIPRPDNSQFPGIAVF